VDVSCKWLVFCNLQIRINIYLYIFF
jgi:hypothetical protein